MKEELLNTIKKILEEFLPNITTNEIRVELKEELDTLAELIEHSYEKLRVVVRISDIRENVVKDIDVENVKLRDVIDTELTNMIDLIVGIDPDDEDDSVPPLECAFYGFEWDDM